jgi:hypothetical protein
MRRWTCRRRRNIIPRYLQSVLVPQLPEGGLWVPDTTGAGHVAAGRTTLLHHHLVHWVVQHLLHQLDVLNKWCDLLPLALPVVKFDILLAALTSSFPALRRVSGLDGGRR